MTTDYYSRFAGPNVQLVHPHRHIPRLWEQNRYWQSELAKNPRRKPLEDDGLTKADLATMPESVRMPTIRAGWNAERWNWRQNRHRPTKKMHHDKWWRDMIGGHLSAS
jgi:hypothetical protein